MDPDLELISNNSHKIKITHNKLIIMKGDLIHLGKNQVVVSRPISEINGVLVL